MEGNSGITHIKMTIVSETGSYYVGWADLGLGSVSRVLECWLIPPSTANLESCIPQGALAIRRVKTAYRMEQNGGKLMED